MNKRTHRHHKRNSNRNKRRTSKNILKKGFSVVQTTSQRYMPKVKTGLERVGSNVTNAASKGMSRTMPMVQRKARDLLGMIGLNKSRRNKRVSFLII
jgi:hypothetical protein